LLLIGNLGTHLTSLVKLAMYIADVHYQHLDCTKPSLFYDSLRAGVQAAGSDNMSVGVILTVTHTHTLQSGCFVFHSSSEFLRKAKRICRLQSKELVRDEYIHAISSLLNNGECSSDLFTIDEMSSIYHAIGSNIKREYPNMVLDPKKMFTTRIKRNFHVCIALEATSPSFQLIVQHYAGIVTNCHVYWIRDWTEESLLVEAKHFM
jgi:dynein heavy chain